MPLLVTAAVLTPSIQPPVFLTPYKSHWNLSISLFWNPLNPQSKYNHNVLNTFVNPCWRIINHLLDETLSFRHRQTRSWHEMPEVILDYAEEVRRKLWLLNHRFRHFSDLQMKAELLPSDGGPTLLIDTSADETFQVAQNEFMTLKHLANPQHRLLYQALLPHKGAWSWTLETLTWALESNPLPLRKSLGY